MGEVLVNRAGLYLFEYVCVCYRYIGRWRGRQMVEVQPPFLRPALTEAQLEAKVLDNGIQNDRHSTRVSYNELNKHMQPV